MLGPVLPVLPPRGPMKEHFRLPERFGNPPIAGIGPFGHSIKGNVRNKALVGAARFISCSVLTSRKVIRAHTQLWAAPEEDGGNCRGCNVAYHVTSTCCRWLVNSCPAACYFGSTARKPRRSARNPLPSRSPTDAHIDWWLHTNDIRLTGCSRARHDRTQLRECVSRRCCVHRASDRSNRSARQRLKEVRVR